MPDRSFSSPDSPALKPHSSKLFVSIAWCCGAALLCWAEPAVSEGPDPTAVLNSTEQQQKESPPAGASKWSFPLGRGQTLLLGPRTELYPSYLADPKAYGFAFQYMHVSKSQIPDSGNSRFGIKIGDSFGLIRIHPEGEPDRGFQFDVGANFIGQFDIDHSLDNIGWDGLYGLALTWADGRGLAFKFGTQHDSSHVGDEYAERSGRKRIGYTREELVLGASRAFAGKWRVYTEGGWAYHLSSTELQKPWRAQFGLEYLAPDAFWGGRMGWYAATNNTFYQESDWRANTAVQLGFVLPPNDHGRRYRFGVEYYHGRSILGEFFRNNETSVSLGVWIDL